MFEPRREKKSLTAFKRADMVKLMDDDADRPGIWKHIHSILRELLDWAVDRQDIEVSPLAGMKAPKVVTSWLRIPTLHRRQGVAKMDWNEIDLEARTRTLPTERVKNDEAHVVPISPLAVEQLRAMLPKRAGLVFTTTGETPVSGFSRAKRLLDQHMMRIMTERLDHSSAELSPIVIPDWRF